MFEALFAFVRAQMVLWKKGSRSQMLHAKALGILNHAGPLQQPTYWTGQEALRVMKLVERTPTITLDEEMYSESRYIYTQEADQFMQAPAEDQIWNRIYFSRMKNKRQGTTKQHPSTHLTIYQNIAATSTLPFHFGLHLRNNTMYIWHWFAYFINTSRTNSTSTAI